MLNLRWAISFYIWTCIGLFIAATHHKWLSLYIEEGDIRNSKYTAVYWQGGATLSAGAERCSALTITWLKVTENNNDWDEAEAITFGGEPAKTAVPIPFTKELSSYQMMRVTGFHFPFSPCRCFTELFLHLKASLLQSLNSCRDLFFRWWRWLWQLAPHLGNVGFCVEERFMWNRVSIQLWRHMAVM